MPIDPIIDEIRAARDAIAKEFDYDIEKIAQAIKAREVASGREVVRLAPRKVTVPDLRSTPPLARAT
jgi:hypothetical protein